MAKITLKEIFTAMCSHLAEVTGVSVFDSDMTEPVVRPSFKVFMNVTKSDMYSWALRRLRVNFNIYFYASDRRGGKAEIFDIEDKISFSFIEPFEIREGCLVTVDEIDFERMNMERGKNGVGESILAVSLAFEIGSSVIDEDGLEDMEELYISEDVHEENDTEIGKIKKRKRKRPVKEGGGGRSGFGQEDDDTQEEDDDEEDDTMGDLDIG